MTKHKNKVELLEMMRTTYANFDALIAGLSAQQMQTPGVNGHWSVKDNIAHLSSWESHLVEKLQAIEQGTSWTDPHLDDTDEKTNETNERFYQQHKDRPLMDVLTDFQAIHQQVITYTENLSEEALNTPREWLEGEAVTSRFGSSVEHYQEHEQIIRDWLAGQDRTQE